eukprot:TRINITY_DN3046_c0_g2_i4.p1 TRINITY_DN3046_c0_g2~~TRINITY_DN3046_c0_g2_i4.p1  ORF type:complete len:906 (+),score=164.89 TRINITY_DN3046_c0_g2_i4:153-2870(+)
MMCLIFLLLSLSWTCLCDGLRDDPIVGDSVYYLDGNWTLSDGDETYTAVVPGDIITDLQRAGLIGDPLYDQNWLKYSDVWTLSSWDYSINFTYPPFGRDTNEIYLVFDGIKMGADITLNGHHLGSAADQFVRYTFPVKELLHPDSNDIHVTFGYNFSQDIDCEGRFMACTGGWDWAPYSNTYDAHGAHTLSYGIWKSVYLVSVSSVGIVNVVPEIFWMGDYPTSIITDSTNKFSVNVTVFLVSPLPVSGTLQVLGEWGSSVTKPIILPAGESSIVLSMDATNVNLWWPNGLGNQSLYDLVVTFVPKTFQPSTSVSTSRRVGFRVVALVTADDSDPSKIVGSDGSGNLTMRVKVNGADLWIRGGNMIPMESFEGRANEVAFEILVRSAADGNFNLLRVWGGGIFYYNVFYDKCDEYGILLYHDMMFAQLNHSPSISDLQKTEILYNVRRLSHHPSIIIWDACNECKGQGIYNDFVITTVIEADKSRPVWPSCPSFGYASGVDTLYGLPNGNELQPRPFSQVIEKHGAYIHGNGYTTVNDLSGKLFLFPANIPPTLMDDTPIGKSLPGMFASEFGCVGMSSFESMSVTLPQEDWGLRTPPMQQRNYPCDNIIDVYWGKKDLNETGELAFKRQLYQCLIGQALVLKSDIEVRKSTNEWGTVLWQLNEIWPTGGWGSVEYGTPVPGQVVGGRWKPIHHWLSESLFRDITSTCSASNPPRCNLNNDSPFPISGKVEVTIVRFSDGASTTLHSADVSLDAGARRSVWFCAAENSGGTEDCLSWASVLKKGRCGGADECFLKTSFLPATVASDTDLYTNFVLLTTLNKLKLPKVDLKWTVDPSSGNVTLINGGEGVVLFVTLTTQAQGRFLPNVFIMEAKTVQVQFIWFGVVDVELLSKTLRVEHVHMYQYS